MNLLVAIVFGLPLHYALNVRARWKAWRSGETTNAAREWMRRNDQLHIRDEFISSRVDWP